MAHGIEHDRRLVPATFLRRRARGPGVLGGVLVRFALVAGLPWYGLQAAGQGRGVCVARVAHVARAARAARAACAARAARAARVTPASWC